jgi:hypothetical protein
VIALTLPLAVTDSTVEALLPLFSADVVMPVAQAVDVKQDLYNTKNKISYNNILLIDGLTLIFESFNNMLIRRYFQ